MFDWYFSSEDHSPQESESETRHSEFDTETEALIEAIHRSQAVIEFEPDGTILTANDNFLAVMGCDLADIEGEHHRIFVEDDYARSEEYRAFWEKLRRGEYHEGRLKRLARDGREVWLQATYNPVFGPDGEVQKIVKFADDRGAVLDQRADFSEHRVDFYGVSAEREGDPGHRTGDWGAERRERRCTPPHREVRDWRRVARGS